MLVKVDPIGVNTDISGHDQDMKSWTTALNMRFNNFSAEKFQGEVVGSNTVGQAYHLLFNGEHDNPLWYYMGDGSIHNTDFETDIDLDVGNLVSDGKNWDAVNFNKFPIFNNTVDAPWTLLANDSQVDPIPAFPANTRCNSIRPFKSFLFALGIIENGTAQRNRVIWSDASDSGALPPSWDIADPTTLAGDNWLTQERGEIIDGLALRDFFVIYKTHSATMVTFVGGQSVMKFQKIQINSGLLAKNCVTEFKGRHFCVGDGDIYLFDGQNIESIAEDRVRKEIFDNISPDYFYNTYVVRYDRSDEIWVCYPEGTSEFATKACVWNWNDDTWTFRDLFYAPHIGSGLTDFVASPTWNSSDVLWKDADYFWKLKSNNPTSDSIAKISTLTLNKLDEGIDVIDQPMITLLEKVTMSFDTPSQVKIVTKIIPQITGLAGTRVYIRLGTQMNPYDQINWLDEESYVIDTDREVSTIGTGRFFSVRVRTQELNEVYTLHGLEFELNPSSRF